MAINCYLGIEVPSTTEAPCGGNIISTDCIASPNANSILDLPSGATQTETNAALTTAILQKEQQIEDLQNSILTIDGSETKVEAGDNITVTGAGTNLSPYIVNASSGVLLEKTITEITALINSSSLEIGANYKISGVHPTLYDDGTTQGTTIFLQALTSNKLSLEGNGLFYNPKYDQGIEEFGIWSNRSTWSATLTSGTFEGNENITADNGATGQLFTNLDANIFIAISGDWSTAISITGDSSTATATISGIVLKSYSIGDKVIWGGYSWTNLMGYVGSNVDSLIMDFEWEKDVFDLTNYNLILDLIHYDYENDLIVYRADVAGNIVDTSKGANDYWYNDYGFEGNPINIFQWGNNYDYNNGVGVGGNIVESSYCDNINFAGSNFHANTLCTRSFFYANKLSNSSFYSNTLSNDSGFYFNTLSNDSDFYSNTLSSNSRFYSNKLSNSTFYSNKLSNSTFYSNTLSNDSGFYFNTLSNNSSFNSNTLSSNSYFNSNTLSNNSSFNSNTLSNSRFYSNTLSNDSGFYIGNIYSIIGKMIYNVTSEYGQLTGDISASTLIYATYSKTLYRRSDGVSKLRYFNEFDTLVIADITD